MFHKVDHYMIVKLKAKPMPGIVKSLYLVCKLLKPYLPWGIGFCGSHGEGASEPLPPKKN